MLLQFALSVLHDGMLGKGHRGKRLGSPHSSEALGLFAVFQMALPVLLDGWLCKGLPVADTTPAVPLQICTLCKVPHTWNME